MLQNLFYVLFACTAIQVLKFLIEFFVFVFSRKGKLDQTQETGVSIIVCSKNEKERLPKVIGSLLEQDYSEKEIIIVDDRSTDDSYDLLLTYQDKIKLVRIDQTPDHINNKKYAITLGVRAASFSNLLFIDADCIPKHKSWVSSMMSNYKGTFVLGFSQYFKEKGLLNGFIRYETLISGMQYLTFAKLGNPYMGVGRNLGYRKEVFIQEKGFHGYNEIVGGDDDLFVNKHANRKNTYVNISPEGLVQSYPEKTFRSYYYQKKRHLSVSKYYKAKDKFILGIISLSHILFWGSIIPLAVLQYEPIMLIILYGSRLSQLIISSYLASLKLGDRINLILTPIYDFLYTLYLLVIGTTAMFSKKIRWN